MSLITGVRGRVEIPVDAIALTGTPDTVIVNITRWSADIQRDVLDVSVFEDVDGSGNPTNARSKIGGVFHVTGGTAEGFIESTAPIDLGTASGITVEDAVPVDDFVLYTLDNIADAGVADRAATTAGHKRLRFAALISQIVYNTEKVGMARFTLNFESSGEVDIDTWTP